MQFRRTSDLINAVAQVIIIVLQWWLVQQTQTNRDLINDVKQDVQVDGQEMTK